MPRRRTTNETAVGRRDDDEAAGVEVTRPSGDELLTPRRGQDDCGTVPGGTRVHAASLIAASYLGECPNMHRSLERTLDECGWMRAAGTGDVSRKGGSPSRPDGY